MATELAARDSSNPGDRVMEPGKGVPVAYDVDVVVAGAGIAGTIAAIAAGRHGARTLVVDRFGQLGGNMGPGLWAGGTLHLALIHEKDPDDAELINQVGMGGIPDEFHRRVIEARPDADQISPTLREELERCHLNVEGYRMGSGGGLPGYLVDSQVTSHIALEMMDEAGVEMLMSVYVGDPIMEENRVRGLFVETKSGRLAVRAKVVIDASGEADVAFRAGAPVAKVGAPNLGLYYALGNVDWAAYRRFSTENAQASEDDIQWATRTFGAQVSEADLYGDVPHLLSQLRHAWESDEFRYVRKVGDCTIKLMMKEADESKSVKYGIVGGRTGTVGEIDFSDAKQVTLMERAHRELVYSWAQFLRKHAPGFEDSFLVNVSPYLHARGGRYLDSEYALTAEDLEAERRFPDVIYLYCDRRTQKNCEVPYRMLVPKGIDGLLASGRASHVYGPNLRARCYTMLNGQAAGVAAALCVRSGVEPRALDVKELQRALLELRCPFADEPRLRELGLR